MRHPLLGSGSGEWIDELAVRLEEYDIRRMVKLREKARKNDMVAAEALQYRSTDSRDRKGGVLHDPGTSLASAVGMGSEMVHEEGMWGRRGKAGRGREKVIVLMTCAEVSGGTGASNVVKFVGL